MINGNIRHNPALPTYAEVVADFPAVLTAPTTATPLYSGAIYKWVTAFTVRVRSMGTATYIALGDKNVQDWRMITVGQTFGISLNPGEVLDLSKIYVVSDTGDATVEVVATYLPVPMYGNVILAIGQRVG